MNSSIVPALIVLMTGFALGYFTSQQCSARAGTENANQKKDLLRRTMKKLWIDQTIWDRQFVISTIAGLKDAQACKERLLMNQDEIGNTIASFYGKETGAHLASLLKEHILIGGDIVKAAMAKNDVRVKDLDKQWRKNVTQIAQLLSKANPENWTESQLATMFNKRLDLLTQGLYLRLSGDWTAEIAKADETIAYVRVMGKDLADGIIKQFPATFGTKLITNVASHHNRYWEKSDFGVP